MRVSEMSVEEQTAIALANRIGPIVTVDPFSIDYSDREAVIEFAKLFGPGQIVINNPLARGQYAITHAEKADRYDPKDIVFRT